MAKKLSPWCKNAKIAMIEKDINIGTLAKALGMNRSYVSTIINGRVYSPPAVKRISDYLGIQDSDTTTV
jgi:plasmid maintenance system antidote protein VapI